MEAWKSEEYSKPMTNTSASGTKKTKREIILTIAVVATALVIWLFFTLFYGKTEHPKVEIVVGGKVTQTYDLYVDQTVEIKGEFGNSNTLVIKDKSCYMSCANCPDQVCVLLGKISKNGESIICLPHELVVRISSSEENEVDATAK